MVARISIGDREVSDDSSPFVIAEAGVNYEGDIRIAKKMIDEAAQAGADAVKFQTYKAEKLAVSNSPAYWDTTQTQRQFFKQYDQFGEEEYALLAEHCRKRNVVFLSTPFYQEAVDFLDKLVPAFKIASADITNFPFLRYVARKHKPILLSTGASTLEEIKSAVELIEEEGNSKIVIMHCVLSYPTSKEDANLGMISSIKRHFPQYLVGYSDHTLADESMIILTAAYWLGARVIEKHFTLDKSLPGNDHYHAMDPKDLKRFVSNLRTLTEVIGKEEKTVLECEKSARRYARRSLVSKRKIQKGEVITEELLTWKRPGTGISPAKIEEVVGKRAVREIPEDSIIHPEDII